MMLLDAIVFLLKTTQAISISTIAILLPNANVTITKDIVRLLYVLKVFGRKGKNAKYKIQIFCSFSYSTKIILPKLFYFTSVYFSKGI